LIFLKINFKQYGDIIKSISFTGDMICVVCFGRCENKESGGGRKNYTMVVASLQHATRKGFNARSDGSVGVHSLRSGTVMSPIRALIPFAKRWMQ
jgi:hypothetical protein